MASSRETIWITFAAAAGTLVVVVGVLAGPTILYCSSAAEGLLACLRGEVVEAGLMPGEEPPPQPVAAVPAEPAPAPEPGTPAAPDLDLIRAEPDGHVIIAGSAEPGIEVEVFANGDLVGKVMAEASGDWVLVPDHPLAVGAAEITVGIAGSNARSPHTFTVVIPEDKSSPPVITPSTTLPTEPAVVAAEPAPTPTSEASPPTAVAEPTPESAAEPEPIAPAPAPQVAEAPPPQPEPAPAPEDAEAPPPEPEPEPIEQAPAPEPEPPAPVPEPVEQPTQLAEAEPPVQAPEPETAVPPVEQVAEPAPTPPAPEPEPVQQAEVLNPEPTAEAPMQLAEAEPPAPTPAPPVEVTPVPSAPATIDAIEIDGSANFFAGAGPDGATVRLYVQDKFIASATVEGGRWLVEASGALTLPVQRVRIDLFKPQDARVSARAEVNFVIDVPPPAPDVTVAGSGSGAVAPAYSASGDLAVTPQVESQLELDPTIPTLRALPSVAPEMMRFASGKAIIRRGETLWAIAARVYGEGKFYDRIVDANDELRRNPGRIFPGQVFDLPKLQDPGAVN